MGKMKVLFLEDVGRLGRAGEVREVANGYARNYLLPRNLAAPATNDQLQRVEKVRKAAEARRIREQNDMKALAELLEGTAVEFSMRASSSGRLFGSVTNIHIAEKLTEMLGVPVDRRTISLGDPIREPGTFEVEIKLPQQTSAMVTVVVVGEGPGALRAAAEDGQEAEQENVSSADPAAVVEEAADVVEEEPEPEEDDEQSR